MSKKNKIQLKTKAEIEYMRQNGRIIAEIFEKFKEIIKPGISTLELDKIAEEYIVSKGGIPSFKGYQGYPASICTSINEVIIHGIPREDQILAEGDIIGIDIGVYKNNLHADSAFTFRVGEIDEIKTKLCDTTMKALKLGLATARSGKTIFDIANMIQNCVEAEGFSVVREFVGHGVGRTLHEPPQIPNYRKRDLSKIKLKPGMTLAIEPMVNAGMKDIIEGDDKWTISTADGKPSAHYEHTVAITDRGPVILTAL